VIVWVILLLNGPVPAAVPGFFKTREACEGVAAVLLADIPHVCIKQLQAVGYG
jgi:hypothetical protein